MQLSQGLDALERTLLGAVSSDRLMASAGEISREERLSGSEAEMRAFEYIRARLEEYGLRTRLLAHDGYVSWPGPASLTVAGIGSIDCITHAMAPSTQRTVGELVYVESGNKADYVGKSVAGKIILIDGLATPAKIKEAIIRGTIAQIFVNDDNPRQTVVSPVWGNPTPSQVSQLPATPVISVKRHAGDRLKTALKRGPVNVSLQTEVDTRWRRLPLLEAYLPGTAESGQYVLLSAHVDCWHHGAMDNASANAVLLEVARVLSEQRESLRRGVRLCFWSGHAQGRYAGSAWYADNCWDDLHRNCVAHVNVNSPGAKGATVLSEGCAMAETRDLAHIVIKRETGVPYTGIRPIRSWDQSFMGLGIPSLFSTLSEQLPDSTSISSTAICGSKSGGLGYWWHTAHDTMDRLDPHFLARDCRIYLAVIFRLCAESVLPFNCRAAAEEYQGLLEEYQREAGSRFDLQPALQRAAKLVESVSQFAEEADGLRARPTGDNSRTEAVNRCMVALSRALIPSNYTAAGPFDQDPALPMRPLPLLAPISDLCRTTEESDAGKHCLVGLVRARNQVCFALDQALAALQSRR